MNNRKYLFLLFFSFLIYSCNDSNGTAPINNSNYPLSNNLEWEYNTTFETGYYDTLGNIKNTEELLNQNTVVRIEAINDKLNNFNDLIRIISLEIEVGKAVRKGTIWYENRNDGLYAIASINSAATQFVFPKIVNGKKYLTINDLKKFNLFLSFNLKLNKTSDDSLSFWSPSRKVLGYPLEIGNTWTELQNFIKRDRIVESKINITIDGIEYSVYKIAAIWPSFGLIFNDYISKRYGLVFREIIADSLLITTSEFPNGIGFAKMKTNTKIVRRNF